MARNLDAYPRLLEGLRNRRFQARRVKQVKVLLGSTGQKCLRTILNRSLAQFEENMSNKEKRQQEYEKMQHQGARPHPEKNQLPLNRTEGGSARHSGREIPAPTKSFDFTDAVSNLPPRDK